MADSSLRAVSDGDRDRSETWGARTAARAVCTAARAVCTRMLLHACGRINDAKAVREGSIREATKREEFGARDTTKGSAYLVGVGREEHRQQRDRENGKRGNAHNGRKGEEALVALVNLHGGLHRLRHERESDKKEARR